MEIDLEAYRANAFSPCIRVQIGPGSSPLDFFEVDQAYWEEHKQEFIDFCLNLPEVEGCTWRQLKQYTGGNGMLAKLLVVLGDLAEVWKMHPPRDAPQGLWTRDTPLILAGQPRSRSKPSLGNLEPTASCLCCERPMGPPNSLVHDLPASEEDPQLCLECEVMGCELERGPCHVFPEKKASEKPKLQVLEDESAGGVPDGLAAYLRQFE